MHINISLVLTAKMNTSNLEKQTNHAFSPSRVNTVSEKDRPGFIQYFGYVNKSYKKNKNNNTVALLDIKPFTGSLLLLSDSHIWTL